MEPLLPRNVWALPGICDEWSVAFWWSVCKWSHQVCLHPQKKQPSLLFWLQPTRHRSGLWWIVLHELPRRRCQLPARTTTETPAASSNQPVEIKPASSFIPSFFGYTYYNYMLTCFSNNNKQQRRWWPYDRTTSRFLPCVIYAVISMM